MNKKEYAALCFPRSEHVQKYIVSKTFEVIELLDGFASVEKSSIKKDFCFGAGMNASATVQEITDAENMTKAAKRWEFFREENTRERRESIEILEKAINGDESGLFMSRDNRLAVIGIFDQYINEKGPKAWQVLDSDFVYDVITPEKIIEGATAKNRIVYRLATRAELSALLEAEKRELVDFEKRLARWWKRYGIEGLNVWTYIRD